MKRILLIIVICALSSTTGITDSSAVPPGMKVMYKGGDAGEVVFDGKGHRLTRSNCIDCHPDIFIMKGNIKITMADIYDNKFCGACHNGERSFDAKKQENCTRCHKK